MFRKLTPSASGEITLSNTIPTIFSKNLLPNAQAWSYVWDNGYVLLQEVGGEATVRLVNLLLTGPDELIFSQKEQLLSLRFILNNTFDKVLEGTYNIGYWPTDEVIITGCEGDTYLEIEIIYSDHTLLPFAEQVPALKWLLQLAEDEKPGMMLHPQHKAITASILQAIHLLFRPGLSERFNAEFLKAVTFDLLFSALH